MATETQNDDLMTAGEIAELVGLTTARILQLDDELCPIRRGRHRIYSGPAARAWIEARLARRGARR